MAYFLDLEWQSSQIGCAGNNHLWLLPFVSTLEMGVEGAGVVCAGKGGVMVVMVVSVAGPSLPGQWGKSKI